MQSLSKICTGRNTHTYTEKCKESVNINSTHHMGMEKHCGEFYAMIRNFFMDDSSTQMNTYMIKASAPKSCISLVIVYTSNRNLKRFLKLEHFLK